MKVAVILDSISRLNGGVFLSEQKTHQTIARQPGVDIEVFGCWDHYTEADAESWSPLRNSSYVRRGPGFVGYCPGLLQAIVRWQPDLCYRAGLWKYGSLATLTWHKRTKRPYIVATHGMLDSWALRKSSLKKSVARILYENEHLRRASCIRALCEAEVEAIRALGLANPCCIVPNGVPLPPDVEKPLWDSPEGARSGGKKVLLYLGRIDPKKGLTNLLKAWQITLELKRCNAGEWVLAIAGWNQGGYESELRMLAQQLGLVCSDMRSKPADWNDSIPGNNQLLFLGSQTEDGKSECYRRCNAFILPSFSEGLPAAVLEAWSFGKPVLMTPQCNLEEGFRAGAAIRIETNQESIGEGLASLMKMSDHERALMGGRGLELVKREFALSTVRERMVSVYSWVLGKGSKPECVV
jgi:glycosyltransferase involved in cell wall biosynthesis